MEYSHFLPSNPNPVPLHPNPRLVFFFQEIRNFINYHSMEWPDPFYSAGEELRTEEGNMGGIPSNYRGQCLTVDENGNNKIVPLSLRRRRGWLQLCSRS